MPVKPITFNELTHIRPPHNDRRNKAVQFLNERLVWHAKEGARNCTLVIDGSRAFAEDILREYQDAGFIVTLMPRTAIDDSTSKQTLFFELE